MNKRKMVLAIDPGTEHSAYVFWDGENIGAHNIVPNVALLGLLRTLPHDGITLLIEQIRSYGMAVGATTLDTVHWSGRFHEAWEARNAASSKLLVMRRREEAAKWDAFCRNNDLPESTRNVVTASRESE